MDQIVIYYVVYSIFAKLICPGYLKIWVYNISRFHEFGFSEFCIEVDYFLAKRLIFTRINQTSRHSENHEREASRYGYGSRAKKLHFEDAFHTKLEFVQETVGCSVLWGHDLSFSLGQVDNAGEIDFVFSADVSVDGYQSGIGRYL